MVPLRLFRSRAYSAGNAACLCVFAVLFGMVFFMAQFLQTGLGYDPLGAGLRLAVFAVALIWIALIARTGLPYADMVVPLILAGSGVSVAIPSTQSVVMTAVVPADIGQASGTFNTLRQLGGVFGVAICAAVFAAHGSYASPATFVSGFGPGLGACAGLALAGAIAGLAIPGRRQPAPGPVAAPVEVSGPAPVNAGRRPGVSR